MLMLNRVSNLITLDLVKKLREIKNVSAKNYSYDAQKILADEINGKVNGEINGKVNGEINKVNGEINKVDREINGEVNRETNKQLFQDFLFIHKYGLDIWLKT